MADADHHILPLRLECNITSLQFNRFQEFLILYNDLLQSFLRNHTRPFYLLSANRIIPYLFIGST